MSGTIKFMALLQILPAVFRFFYNKKGIKIAIRLLCLFDDVNDLIRTPGISLLNFLSMHFYK